MKNRQWRIYSAVIALVLILAILPSFTALSESYTLALPGLASKTGPLNPLKLFAPLVFLFVVIGVFRTHLHKERGFWVLSGAWVIGTIFTYFAASRCAFPPMFLREWASISLGLLVGISLRIFSPTLKDRVFYGWMAVIFLAVVLDLFFPSSIDWLYVHIFDPETRKWDFGETGTHPLTGVFGRQSAAKLMAWVPWLVLPVLIARYRRFFYLILMGLGIWSGLILATSQRGPMIAAFGALFVFGVHRAWWERNWRLFLITSAVIFLGIGSIFLTVPANIVGPRLLHTSPNESLDVPARHADQLLEFSNANARFRLGMTRVSLDSIRVHPMGNACIPKSFFTERGMNEGHSHSLFLEQFRSRGWIWGALHLGLWILCALSFLRAPDLRASCYLAAVISIVVSGLVDHPWFVLNQSIVLGAVLVEGVVRFFEKTSGRKNAV